jgi:DNA invertase Pin-like site-specific DNA recombinase
MVTLGKITGVCTVTIKLLYLKKNHIMLAIYCRISGKKEEGADISISVQEAKGIALAKKLDLPYTVYKDEGVSGTATIEERPSFKEIIQGIENKEITHLFVNDNSRLERNTEERFKILAILKLYNIELYTEQGKFNYDDAQTALFGNMESLFNSYFVATTKKKVKEALLKKVQNGETRGILPYGYMKEKTSKKMIINPDEAPIIKNIYELSLSGMGTNSIAKYLNENEVPTRYNKIGKGTVTTTDKYTGKKTTTDKKEISWAGNTIRNIITNPVFKGERKWNKEIYKCPAIFTPEYWQKVNDNLKKNANNTGKKVQHKYLLKGLLRCGVCGRNYYGRSRVNKKDHYYQCSSKRTKSCGNRSINIDKLETFIWKRLFMKGEFISKIEKEYTNTDSKARLNDISNELKKKYKEVSKIEKQREKAIGLVIRGLVSEEELKQTLTTLSNKIESLKEIIAQLKKEENKITSSQEVIEEYKNLFDKYSENTTFQEKKKLVNDVIKNIVITTKDNYFHLEVSYKIDILNSVYETDNLLANTFYDIVDFMGGKRRALLNYYRIDSTKPNKSILVEFHKE